jgi:hypothetical protein
MPDTLRFANTLAFVSVVNNKLRIYHRLKWREMTESSSFPTPCGLAGFREAVCNDDAKICRGP